MAEASVSKRGRKPLPEDEKRVYTVSARLNEDELRELDDLRGPKARGEWIREAALGAPVASPPKINAQAWADLGHGLSNLNQIAKRLNSGKSIEHAALEAKIISVRNQLLGILQ